MKRDLLIYYDIFKQILTKYMYEYIERRNSIYSVTSSSCRLQIRREWRYVSVKRELNELTPNERNKNA